MLTYHKQMLINYMYDLYVWFVTSERWPNKTPPPVVTLNNNILRPIYKQKYLPGSFGIQIGDCEILVQSKMQKNWFEKAGLHLRQLTHQPWSRLQAQKQLHIPMDLAMAPFCLGSALNTMHQSQEESCLHVYWIRGTQTLVMAMDSEVANELAAASLSCSKGATKGKTAKLYQNIDSERAPPSAP